MLAGPATAIVVPSISPARPDHCPIPPLRPGSGKDSRSRICSRDVSQIIAAPRRSGTRPDRQEESDDLRPQFATAAMRTTQDPAASSRRNNRFQARQQTIGVPPGRRYQRRGRRRRPGRAKGRRGGAEECRHEHRRRAGPPIRKIAPRTVARPRSGGAFRFSTLHVSSPR